MLGSSDRYSVTRGNAHVQQRSSLLEALHIRVEDLDFGTSKIVVRRGKGGRDESAVQRAVKLGGPGGGNLEESDVSQLPPFRSRRICSRTGMTYGGAGAARGTATWRRPWYTPTS